MSGASLETVVFLGATFSGVDVSGLAGWSDVKLEFRLQICRYRFTSVHPHSHPFADRAKPIDRNFVQENRIRRTSRLANSKLSAVIAAAMPSLIAAGIKVASIRTSVKLNVARTRVPHPGKRKNIIKCYVEHERETTIVNS